MTTEDWIAGILLGVGIVFLGLLVILLGIYIGLLVTFV